MHRSGTTFLGQVFDNLDKCYVLHEPFNRKYGLEGLSYDYCDLENNISANKMFDALINDQKLNFINIAERDNTLKKIARRYIGGRTEVQWRLYLKLFKHKQLILKDPFLSKSTHFLSNTYNTKSIVVIRHPCAVWYSIKQMRWTMDMKKYCSSEHSVHAIKLNSDIEKFCYVWCDIAKYNAKPNRNIKLVSHETLCEKPYETIEECLNFFNFTINDRVLQFIKNNMFASSEARNYSNLHQFKRDASVINNQWRSALSQAEISKILRFTQGLVELHYER